MQGWTKDTLFQLVPAERLIDKVQLTDQWLICLMAATCHLSLGSVVLCCTPTLY